MLSKQSLILSRSERLDLAGGFYPIECARVVIYYVFEMFEAQIPLVSLSDTVPDVAVVHRSEFVLRHPALDKPLKLSHLQVSELFFFLGGFEKTQRLFLKRLSHIITYL